MDYINPTYKVYIKTNDNNVITAVNSSAFLRDTTDWTEIDKGTGDKYHHAQGNYLPVGLMDERGLYNYKLVDGKPVLRTDEDKLPEIDKLNARTEIAQLKRRLAETDYIGIKIGEGAAKPEEYAKERAQRAEWRARINELEANHED